MGHIRLGILPRYAKWKDVISLLGDTEVPASQVGHKVLDSSAEALETQSAQSSVAYCVWLIAQLTLASRSEDFKGTLARLGIHAGEETSPSSFRDQIDRDSEPVVLQGLLYGAQILVTEQVRDVGLAQYVHQPQDICGLESKVIFCILDSLLVVRNGSTPNARGNDEAGKLSIASPSRSGEVGHLYQVLNLQWDERDSGTSDQ